MELAEKVYKGLENCFAQENCYACPYSDYTLCKKFLIVDSMKVIKTQHQRIVSLESKRGT